MNEKTVIAEKAPVKKAVAEKAPAKKPAAKKARAKKPAAKKVQAKQPAVKTAPIRKVAPAKTAMKAFENSVFAMPLKVANKTFMASLGIFSYSRSSTNSTRSSTNVSRSTPKMARKCSTNWKIGFTTSARTSKRKLMMRAIA